MLSSFRFNHSTHALITFMRLIGDVCRVTSRLAAPVGLIWAKVQTLLCARSHMRDPLNYFRQFASLLLGVSGLMPALHRCRAAAVLCLSHLIMSKIVVPSVGRLLRLM